MGKVLVATPLTGAIAFKLMISHYLILGKVSKKTFLFGKANPSTPNSVVVPSLGKVVISILKDIQSHPNQLSYSFIKTLKVLQLSEIVFLSSYAARSSNTL